MLQMPLRYEFVPQRWRQVLQIIISKDTGQPKIDRLKNILLLEADYNPVLKTIWGCRLMNRVQEQNLLHNGQHARPRNLASTASLNKNIIPPDKTNETSCYMF